MAAFQRTLAASVSLPGVGYWSDRDVQVTFSPAEPNTGLIFVRDDLPETPRIPAAMEYRIEIPRRTSLEKDGVRVEMVEHILSALVGMQVDNCEIHVDSVEMPGLDGSARAVVEALDSVGYETQDVPVPVLTVSSPLFQTPEESIYVHKSPISSTILSSKRKERWISVTPSENFSASFEICYGSNSPIGNQSVSFSSLTPDVYRREIAPCRTFVTQEEAEAFLNAGLARRTTFQDLLVFGPNGPVGNSLIFSNECARHKMLDLLGDLALLRSRLHAHVEAYCSGHDLNTLLVRQLLTTHS